MVCGIVMCMLRILLVLVLTVSLDFRILCKKPMDEYPFAASKMKTKFRPNVTIKYLTI